ncbi:MAG: hypothetical protein COA67_04875 [Lutibacter sp.]|nr:MAG: hypothetical protein COA67_04875 [Lutibacter sp.]
MKTIKFLKLILVAFVTITVASCVDSDEYDVPPVAQQLEPNITVTSSIQNVKSALDQHFNDEGESKMTFDGDSDVVFTGYVVSSDYAGNFFESIVIQDSPSNPTHGIEILIDKSSLFESYEVGRKVYVKMAGLSVSYEDGEDNDPTDTDALGRYSVGKDEGGFGLDEVPLYSYLESIVRSTEVETIVPNIISTAAITENHINTFVQLSDMQFEVNELGKTFSGEANDEFDGFRNLVSCADGSEPTLQTSTFADFSSYELPDGVGNMNAVLMKDFRADFLVFVVNSPTDFEFSGTDRCDPVILDCGIASSQGTMNLFNDDFETQTPFSLVTGNGWTNYIETGSEGWEAYTSGGTNSSLGISARMSAYNSNDNDNIGWLIMPSIDFDAQNGETLRFQTSNSFSDDSKMELLFSTDWDGTPANITTATWGVLPAAYIVQDSDFYGSWLDSGIVDLSCATGSMYIAFKYTGGDTNDNTGTYELDEISIDYTP